MYIDLAIWQIVLLAYAAVFSYLVVGAATSAILHTLTGDQIHVIGQIHITLLWPAHIILAGISLARYGIDILLGPSKEE